MKTQKTQLKVKIKSLAAEAKIIRKEEKKTKDIGLKHSLHFHRTWDVRNEARHAQIAYGFLKGVPYQAIEQKTEKLINWKRVYQLVDKFGECVDYFDHSTFDNIRERKREQDKRYLTWKSEAEKYIESCKTNSG